MAKYISKILITGGNGMLGSYFDFGIRTNSDELDVTNIDSVRINFDKYKPKVVIHLAAMTNIDECEKNPEKTYFVNTIGTYNVALVAKEYDTKMIYVSTNAVFSGTDLKPYTKSMATRPNSVYGHSKYAGELITKALSKNYLIIRTSWIFGGGPARDKKFVSKIMQRLKNGDTEIYAVSDCLGTPTFAKDLASEIKKMINRDQTGVIHCTNFGKCSRYNMAKIIVKFYKHNVILKKTSVKNFNPTPPRNETLKSDLKIRSWQNALSEYLTTEWQ